MSQSEVWLRGPIPRVPGLLQPVAHGLLHCCEELKANVTGLTTEQIWARPAGAASIGFHVRHATGSLDRLFTYARGERLSSTQQATLAAEANPDLTPNVGATLLAAFEEAVQRALEQLHMTSETTLLEARGVGRAQLPSTVLGLLFHASEHTHRHVGQVVTTVKILRDEQD
jgi:DinB family protein